MCIINSYVHRHTVCFYIMAIMNKTALNMGMQVSLRKWFHFLSGYIQMWVCWIYRCFICSLLRNLHLHGIFSTGWTNLDSHQECVSVPSPDTLSNTYHLIFLTRAFPIGINWYLIVGRMRTSLKISDVEHLIFNLLATSVTSLEKCLLTSSGHFLINLLALCYWTCEF